MKKNILSTAFCAVLAIQCICFSLRVAAQTWTEKTSMLKPRYGMAAAAEGTDIYVFGGIDSGFTITNTTQAYSTISNSWRICANIPISGVSPVGK